MVSLGDLLNRKLALPVQIDQKGNKLPPWISSAAPFAPGQVGTHLSRITTPHQHGRINLCRTDMFKDIKIRLDARSWCSGARHMSTRRSRLIRRSKSPHIPTGLERVLGPRSIPRQRSHLLHNIRRPSIERMRRPKLFGDRETRGNNVDCDDGLYL